MILSKCVEFIHRFFVQFYTIDGFVPLNVVCIGFFCFCLFGTIFKLICRIKSFAFFGG